VEAHRGAQLGSGARELERGEPTEAVPDRCGRADARLRREMRPRRPRSLAQPRRLGHQLADHAHPVRAIAELFTVQVRCERDVAERREHAHAVALVIAEPGATVKDQDAAARRALGCREQGAEGPARDVVFDALEHAHILSSALI